MHEKVAWMKNRLTELADIEPRVNEHPDKQLSLTDPDSRLMKTSNMVLSCNSLDGEALSEYCIYPHHITQWKLDFVSGNTELNKPISRTEIKNLKHENKVLKKELNRKEKALAETAALLVLQKKVHEIWGSDEDSSL
jgi:hypothetical protein